MVKIEGATLQRLWSFVPALGAGAVYLVVTAVQIPSELARIVALGMLVLSGVLPIFVERADVRSHAAAAAAVGCVVAIGSTKAGLFFAIPSVLFAMLVVQAMRKARDETARIHARGALVMFGVAAAIFGALIVALPPASAIAERRMNRWINSRTTVENQVGFTSTLRLGSTRGMLASDKVVIRILGPSDDIEYLRGAVYDNYLARTWTTSDRNLESVTSQPEVPPPTRIRFASDFPVPQGDEARWFLPPNACNLSTPSAHVKSDVFGVYHPDTASDLPEIAIDTKNCTPAAEAPPRAQDIELPLNIYARLGTLAKDWTKGLGTDAQKVDAIMLHLQTYGYALEVNRNPGLDPVIDFLTVNKQGHCELFASALVLLARLHKIPARVVTGFRVTEHASFPEHAVVRERNAHAWAEVWIDGRWKALDPTPVVEAPVGASAGWEKFRETLSFGWDTVTSELTLTHFIVAAIVAGALYLFRRWWIRRRDARAAKIDPASLPLPCFVTLETSLANAGHPREPSEPVETFAERIASLDRPWAKTVASAARRYASHRYGGNSDETEVARIVNDAARAVSAART